MNYYSDKDDPKEDYDRLFGQSFNNNFQMNENYLSQSMPSYYTEQQALYDNNMDFNNSMGFLNLNQDDFTLSDNLDPSIFLEANKNDTLDLETQQSILLSDPSFLRQQQLLQEEQQKLHQNTPARSNLSAMLGNTATATSPTTTIQPIPLISSQQQKKDILDKTIHGKITKPIPISSSPNINHSSSIPGIDHQRRFNELQARFRVNYAKKPKSNNNTLGTSMPNTSHLSSSYNDATNRRRLSLEPVGSKSVLRLNKEGGGKIKMNSAEPAVSSFPSRTMSIQIQRVHRANGMQNHDLEQRQKKLDDQLVKTDFDDITVSELKEMLRQRGKPATGKKAVLLQRLMEERDLIQHARANGIPILSRYLQQSPVMPSPISHAASLPDSTYLSSSPNNSGIGSLNRSIADMHIGSPPMANLQSRRFAPYSTSPRNSNLAPPPPPTTTKAATNTNMSIYSSSVPTSSLDMMMIQEPARLRGLKRSYAPFTSSALATPDREDDINPFDSKGFDTVKEEDIKQELTPNDMEWTDPSIDFMLQQGVNINEFQDKSTEELLSYLVNHADMNYNAPDITSIMYDDTNAYQHDSII